MVEPNFGNKAISQIELSHDLKWTRIIVTTTQQDRVTATRATEGYWLIEAGTGKPRLANAQEREQLRKRVNEALASIFVVAQ